MKNILFVVLLFSLLSCTKEIYRGEVSYKQNSKSLIQLYGTTQSVWSDDPQISLSDIVQVETTSKLKKFKTKFICSPVLDHCHYDGSGAHVKIHIINDVANESESLEYNGVDYKAAIMEFDGDSSADGVWIEKEFEFSNAPIYAVFLHDENFEFQSVEGRYLILDYTTEEHSGH